MTGWPFAGGGRSKMNALEAERDRLVQMWRALARTQRLTLLELGRDLRTVVACTDGAGLFPAPAAAPSDVGAVAEWLGDREALQSVIDRAQGKKDEVGNAAAAEDSIADDPVPPVLSVLRKPSEDTADQAVWIRVDACAIPGASTDDVGPHVLITLQDITDDRAAAVRTEKRLSLMTRALDHAPFGLVILDSAGAIRDMNTAFRRLVDGRPVSGKPFREILNRDDTAAFDAVMEQLAAVKSGARPPEPLDLRFHDVEDRIVTVYTSQAPSSSPERAAYLLHAIDSTERKRLETQFAQSQKMQAVGQLAGGIAHDFNNVLTAIIGFCDLLLQRHQPGDPSFSDVMQIQQNANRAAGLTRQLLAFSRQQTIRSRVFDVTDALAELSNLLRRLIGERVELSVTHGQDLWPVRGDRGQLEQIIINLAVNARDAMERGGRLIIQTDNFSSDKPYQMREEVMAAGDYVMIAVTDTGMGMSAKVLARIFEPFFTTKEVGQGTGLGLAMVYGSVRQMGGFVVAHSDGPGKGATFSIYLPRATAEDMEELKRGDEAAGKESKFVDDTGGEKILLVEDEDAVRLFSARALRSKGYDVVEARTGEVALSILSDQSFDLLITDMIMPKVDGATLIRKARMAMPELPVICISGYTRDSVAKEVSELPGVTFLSKPFSLKQLSGRVRASLESKEG